VLAVLSQKGGTGKTTLSCAIAALAEQAGHRTVLLDTSTPRAAPATGTTSARTPASNTPTSSRLTPTVERLLDRMCRSGQRSA